MTVRRLVADMRNDAASQSAQTPGPRPMLGGTTYSFWKSAARSGGLWVAQRSQRSLCITLKWERVTSAFQEVVPLCRLSLTQLDRVIEMSKRDPPPNGHIGGLGNRCAEPGGLDAPTRP